MFHSRRLNKGTNHIHERALRIFYKDFKSSIQELLIEDNSLNIYHSNLQKLVIEIFRVINGLSLEFMNNVLEIIEKPYFLQTTSHFRSRSIRATKHGIEKPSYLGSKLWNLVPNEYQTINHLQILRQKQKLRFQRTVLPGYAKYKFIK